MPRPTPESDSISSEELIAVGVVRKSHGVRGEASVEPWTNSLDRFSELEQITLVSPERENSRSIRIIACRNHGERALVTFEGITSPEAVGELRNWTIEIPAGKARELDEHEYFLHDLVGVRVEDTGGVTVGVVRSVSEGGGGILLSVEKSKGGTFDLPFAAAICTTIDLEAGRIVANLPEGIMNLDDYDDSAAESQPEKPQ